MLDYHLILRINYLDKQWSMNGDDYKGLNWLDSSPKPTQAELDAKELAIARINRNDLLKQSDWTQLPNNPLTSEKQEEWAVYRQQLRDIPETIPYVFPTAPI